MSKEEAKIYFKKTWLKLKLFLGMLLGIGIGELIYIVLTGDIVGGTLFIIIIGIPIALMGIIYALLVSIRYDEIAEKL